MQAPEPQILNPDAEVQTVEDPAVKCDFCHQSTINDVEYGYLYKLKELKFEVTAHYFCVLFSSGLSQTGDDHEGIEGFLLPEIRKELGRGSKLKCRYCHLTGASIGCSVKQCKAMFHFTCGVKNGTLHQFCDTFASYCPLHKQTYLPTIPSSIRIPSQCEVCYGEIAKNEPIVWPPCCRVRVFHRLCIAKQAQNSGSYHFKCPTCNDKNSFIPDMKKSGIYVPERDAEWEREPNAYVELLELYSKCDADECACPNGRNYDSNDTEPQWNIVRCSYCGGSAIHFACGILTTPTWNCPSCESSTKNNANIHGENPEKRKEEDLSSSDAEQDNPVSFEILEKMILSNAATSTYVGVERETGKLDPPQEYVRVPNFEKEEKVRPNKDLQNYLEKKKQKKKIQPSGRRMYNPLYNRNYKMCSTENSSDTSDDDLISPNSNNINNALKNQPFLFAKENPDYSSTPVPSSLQHRSILPLSLSSTSSASSTTSSISSVETINKDQHNVEEIFSTITKVFEEKFQSCVSKKRSISPTTQQDNSNNKIIPPTNDDDDDVIFDSDQIDDDDDENRDTTWGEKRVTSKKTNHGSLSKKSKKEKTKTNKQQHELPVTSGKKQRTTEEHVSKTASLKSKLGNFKIPKISGSGTNCTSSSSNNNNQDNTVTTKNEVQRTTNTSTTPKKTDIDEDIEVIFESPNKNSSSKTSEKLKDEEDDIEIIHETRSPQKNYTTNHHSTKLNSNNNNNNNNNNSSHSQVIEPLKAKIFLESKKVPTTNNCKSNSVCEDEEDIITVLSDDDEYDGKRKSVGMGLSNQIEEIVVIDDDDDDDHRKGINGNSTYPKSINNGKPSRDNGFCLPLNRLTSSFHRKRPVFDTSSAGDPKSFSMDIKRDKR